MSKHRIVPPPQVSVVLPVFNGERYLAEAIESLFRQTHQPLEIIVVDDGSTDATAEVIASCGDRVRALRQANSGPAAARNRGVLEGRGEFVAFIDADDLWHAEKLARQLACFERRPEVDACVTQVENFWIPELAEEAERFRDHRISKPTPAYVAATLLARRRLFDTVGLFDETLGFGHSTDWFLRAADRGAVVELVPEVLYRRRLHESNRTRLLNAASRDEYLMLVKRHLDRRRGLQVAEAGDDEPPRGASSAPRR